MQQDDQKSDSECDSVHCDWVWTDNSTLQDNKSPRAELCEISKEQWNKPEFVTPIHLAFTDLILRNID